MARVALVTGASRGIGRGITLALAEDGFDIAGAATKADPTNKETGLYEVKARVEEKGREFLPVTGNIADEDAHISMLHAVLDRFGRIDVLVNNAGVAPIERNDVLDMSAESYDRVMAINLRGPLFFSQRVARQMVRQWQDDPQGPAPVMVFVTSISADTASPNRAEYCISKAGLSMAAANFAVRLADDGVLVYEVRPGIIATEMTAGVTDKYDALIEQGLLLQKRWGRPEDVGRAVAALARGDFAYATGSVFEVGGGFSVKKL
jgi:NAD(P)-dependent dehydrogenase (short-subunit alcohol dehydrogenase family)